MKILASRKTKKLRNSKIYKTKEYRFQASRIEVAKKLLSRKTAVDLIKLSTVRSCKSRSWKRHKSSF